MKPSLKLENVLILIQNNSSIYLLVMAIFIFFKLVFAQTPVGGNYAQTIFLMKYYCKLNIGL